MDEYPVDFIPTDSTEYVFTTHIKDPEHFYVHVESRSKILDDIMDTLADRYIDLGPSDKLLKNKRLGSLCAAKFTDDNNWYRARITGLMKTGMIEVQFVDYGNTDYVSDDRVKALDPDLVRYPVQCYRCSLADVSSSQGYWTPEETVKFEDKTMDQRCQAYFSGKTPDDTYLVYMMDGDGNSLNEMFGAAAAGGGARKPQKSSEDTAGFGELSWRKGSKVQTTVAYVQTPDLFWCQDQSYANELLILSEELSRLHMTQSIEPLVDVRPGVVCAAKFSEDEAWYRGVVKAVSNGAAQVYFVDYGNTESVPLDLICKLSAGMKTMPALAAKCRLSGISAKSGSWDPGVVEQFEELVVDKEFETTIVEREGDTYVVSLVDIVESTDVSSQMRSLIGQTNNAPSRATKADINSNQSQTSASSEVTGIGPSLSVGSCVEAFLTWVDSPGDFWVQLKDYDHLVDKLSSELQEFYSQPRPGAAVSPGAFIVARYSEDEMWYRGLILKEVSAAEVLVLFIDYGNSDTVLKTDLRQVAPAFGEVVPLAFRCALVGVKPLTEDARSWTSDAKSFLEELTQDGCSCKVVSETDSRKLVQLSISGKDVGAELTALNVVAGAAASKVSSCPTFTKFVTVRAGEKESVMVTHVESPTSFWCQLNKNTGPLDSLMEKLESHYSDEGGTSLRDPTTGGACIAQYSEDQAWYRACIKSASHTGYTVQFVDYGNSEVVPDSLVCDPEPRFLDLPVQGIHCSLQVPGDVSHLADAMSDLVMDKELTMEVLEVRNEVAVVELYDGTSRVSDLVRKTSGGAARPAQVAGGITPATPIPVGSTVKAFTSVVLSPSKFYVQRADKEEELGALMDEIAVVNASVEGNKPLSSPQVGQPCMALFSEDNQWYRGTIASLQGSQCTVLFVDYGNEESVSVDGLRVLPPELGAVPVMAYECTLNGTQGMTWSQEAREFFESVIMDQELECTFVTQKAVNISISGSDLSQELAKNDHLKGKEAVKSPKAFGAQSPNSQVNGGFESSPRKGGGDSFRSGTEKRSFGNEKGGWGDSGDAPQASSGFGSNKAGFGNRDKNAPSGFGSNRGEGGSGFGSSRGEGGSGFGSSRGEGGSGFGSNRSDGGGPKERKTSSSSSTASGEFTYPEPPSGPETALLVHMDDDGTFYLQLPSMEREILFLAKRLAGSYKNGGGPRLRDTPATGVVCCSKFPDDGCMYRSLILEVNGDKAVLRYVDYGNVAQCSTRDLKMLFPDLLQYAVQAYPCKLKGLTWSVDQAEKFASATLDKDLEVTFSGSAPPFEVEVKTPDGDLLDILTGKIAFTPSKPSASNAGKKQSGFGGGSSSPAKQSGGGGGFGSSKTPPKSNGMGATLPPPAPKICEQKYPAQSVPAGQVEAYICHIDEDGYFYIQLDKDTASLDAIMAQLDGLSGLGKHPDPCPGAACAAVFSEDSAWYRAKVSSVQGDSLTVVFVDYGNGDVVQKSAIKPLTSDLLTSAPLTFQCQFSDLGPLVGEPHAKLSEYLMEHQVTVTFTTSSSPPYSVAIKDAQGNDLQEVICPSDHYISQASPKSVVPAGVSHIEDDGRYYVQLYADFPAIAALEKDLSETALSGSLEKLDTPEAGLACCFELDQGTWHRGQVVNVTDESVLVMDVDTGKTSSVDAGSLHQLPLVFFKQPPFAYECRLKGVESWTEGLLQKFVEMTEGKILNATFYTSTAPFRVSLARSIELDLLGLSAPVPDSPVREKPAKAVSDSKSESAATCGYDVYISHVEDDGSFYLQRVAQEEELMAMSEQLEAALASATTGDLSMASPGQLVCAKFTEDDAWYRARVESTEADAGLVHVRFVDYGNTDSVTADRVAALPDQFEEGAVPAFARRCVLADVPEVELPSELVEKLRETVEGQVLTVTSSLAADAGEAGWDKVGLSLAGTPLPDMLGLTADGEKEAALTETSGSQEGDEFADASETADGANLNKNTNAEEADEFIDAVETVETAAAAPVPESSRAEAGDIASGSRVSVTVSFAVTPDKFFYQLNQDQERYDALMDEMFEHFSSLPEGEGGVEPGGEADLAVGDMCAALYGEDESWYRATVTDVAEGSYTVFFMDHGNTEVCETDSLRHLPEQFRSLPPWAKQAGLAGVQPAEENWSEEAVSEFKTMVEEKSLLADIISVKDDVTSMRLLELGIPVHEELIKKGYAIASEEDIAINKDVQHVFNETLQESRSEDFGSHSVESENVDDGEHAQVYGGSKAGQGMKIGSIANTVEELKDVSVYVSHVESPSLFWCRLSTCIEALRGISDFLAVAYSAPEELRLTQDAGVGDVVVVRSPQDGLLYRSRVLSHSPSGDGSADTQQATVQFIDFGNDVLAEKEHMYRMEADLCRFPAQAFRCGLDNVRPHHEGGAWPAEASQKFSEIVQDTELSLKLVGRDQGGTLLVQLADPSTGQSIAGLLSEAGFATVLAPEPEEKDGIKCPDSSRPGDISAFESLEMTRPILESTTMVGDTTQAITQPYTVETRADGHFRTLCLSLHTEYDVLICNAELPNSFHVRLLESDAQFSSLLADIEQHVSSEVAGSTPEGFSPEVNDPCLVLHREAWHRATVLDQTEGSWNVKMQDSGEAVSVGEVDLRKLPQHLLELPAQAIPCYLAGVVSVEPEWSSDAIGFFNDSAKDSKFCMYVVEDAHEGKYGVCINDLDSTESSSLNRAMVDLEYAEIVPGSYIDVQMQMEKTLDTDMLNELEESFNEVSMLKCNAEDGKDGEETAGATESGDVPSYCDSYRESEISKACKKRVDPSVYQLLQVSDSVQESPKNRDGGNTTTYGDDRRLPDAKRFSLALDVEKIEQYGCLDTEASDADLGNIGMDRTGEISSESHQPSAAGVDVETSSERHQPEVVAACEGAEKLEVVARGNVMDGEELEKPEECGEEREMNSPESECCKAEDDIKLKSSSPAAQTTKSIYTWKMDTGNSSEKSQAKCDTENTNELGKDELSPEDVCEGSGDVKDELVEICENQGIAQPRERGDKTEFEVCESEDGVSQTSRAHNEGESCAEAEYSSNRVEVDEAQNDEATFEEEVGEVDCVEVEESKISNKYSDFDGKLEVHNVVEDPLQEEDSPSEARGTLSTNMFDGAEDKLDSLPDKCDGDGDKIDSLTNMCLWAADSSGRLESFLDTADKNACLEEDLQQPKNMNPVTKTDSSGLAEPKRLYMSSTPSRNEKILKVLKKVRQGSVQKARRTLSGAATAGPVGDAGSSDQCLDKVEYFKLQSELEEECEFPTDTTSQDKICEEGEAAGDNIDLEQADGNVDIEADSVETQSMEEELESADCSDIHPAEVSGGVEESCTESESVPSSGRDSSVNDASHFISCVGSEDTEDTDALHASFHEDNTETESLRRPAEMELSSKDHGEATGDPTRTTSVSTEASPEPTSLDNTIDEYESCSETGPEDSKSSWARNSLDAIRRSIVVENLSCSSIFSETSDQHERGSSCDASSLMLSGMMESSCGDASSMLLSGSSFDSSAQTCDTTSTLEEEDEEADSSAAAWLLLGEDLHLQRLQSQHDSATTTESSSSCSSETHHGESSESSFSTVESKLAEPVSAVGDLEDVCAEKYQSWTLGLPEEGDTGGGCGAHHIRSSRPSWSSNVENTPVEPVPAQDHEPKGVVANQGLLPEGCESGILELPEEVETSTGGSDGGHEQEDIDGLEQGSEDENEDGERCCKEADGRGVADCAAEWSVQSETGEGCSQSGAMETLKDVVDVRSAVSGESCDSESGTTETGVGVTCAVTGTQLELMGRDRKHEEDDGNNDDEDDAYHEDPEPSGDAARVTEELCPDEEVVAGAPALAPSSRDAARDDPPRDLYDTADTLADSSEEQDDGRTVSEKVAEMEQEGQKIKCNGGEDRDTEAAPQGSEKKVAEIEQKGQAIKCDGGEDHDAEATPQESEC